MITPDRLASWRRMASNEDDLVGRALLDACDEIQRLQRFQENTSRSYRAEIERINVWNETFIEQLGKAEADRDRARDIAVALEQENARLTEQVAEWRKATDDSGLAIAKINRERGAAQDRANSAEAKLIEVAKVKVWTNEDGKKFVFADDLAAALGMKPPTVWSDAVAPGGVVCAAPTSGLPDGICGMPMESEPCPEHTEPTEVYDHETEGL